MSSQASAHPTALITGAANRIGREIALAMAAAGYRVALHYNTSRKAAERTASAIRREGGTCEIFRCDLSNARKTQRLIPQVVKRFKGLDVLINNASVFERSDLRKLDLKDLDLEFAVNFKAPYILTCAYAKLKREGHIINILDTHIVSSRTAHTAYLLSKKSLYELTKIAAVQLAPRIRVNGIAPGLILPPVNKTADHLERLAERVPLKRRGSPANIVRSVLFLLHNDYMTGQVLFNDGGEHLVSR